MAQQTHPTNPLALAVLALLFERPMHPYEMGVTLKQRHKEESTVYAITNTGRDELRTWMADLIGEPIKEYPQFEAALCLLPVLPPDEALALLRRRLARIEQNSTALTQQIEAIADQNFPPLFLVETEYRLALLKAEQHFVAELIRRIENGWGPLELWRGIHDDREATMAKLDREFGGAPMN